MLAINRPYVLHWAIGVFLLAMLGPVAVFGVGWAEPDVSIPATNFQGLLDPAGSDLPAARDGDAIGYSVALPMTIPSSFLADASNAVGGDVAATGRAASRSGAAHGSIKASVATIEPVLGPSAAPLLKKPPVLTQEQRRSLKQALARSHRPGPPLPVESGSNPEAAVPSGPATEVRAPGVEAEAVPLLAPDNFQIFKNNDLGDGAPPEYTSIVNEPSVAQNGEVVFYTGNWYAALSTDGGQTFGFINPFTGPFPPPANSDFCCDQVTLYDPSHNAIFWLQQYTEDLATGTPGSQRINVDMGADGTFDCHYDFTPQGVGEPARRSYDFPDLVLGANYLYHTSNIGSFGSPFVTHAMISRYPLDQIASCGSLQQGFYLVTTDRVSLRPTHGAGTTMYWGAHNSNSSLRIYRWDEGSLTIYWDDRTVDFWASGGGTCPGPDGKDWCGGADGRILGAYVADGVIGFMWNSAQHGAYTYPYVRMARFAESTRSLIDQPTVWSTSSAWQYPSVAVNARGDLGGTILAGGGAYFPQCQVWIADDVNSGVLQPLENVLVVASDSGPDENKSGEYLTSRPHAPLSNTWVGTCFSLQGGGADTNARPRYVWFGRERDAPDPFEPNNSPDEPTGIDCGFASEAARIAPVGGDVDFYQIAAAAGTILTIDIDAAELGSPLDPVLGILNNEGARLVVSDNVPAPGEPPTLDPYLEFVAPLSGNYMVAVSAYDDFDFNGNGLSEGFYTISVACQIPPDPLEPNDSMDSATPIECGFASDAPHITPLGDVDFYALVVPPWTHLAVDIKADEIGSPLDSLLGLFDGNGGLITLSDNSPAPGEPETHDSYLEHTVSEGGTFYIGVSSFADFEFNGINALTTGYYVLSTACEVICPGPDADGDGIPDSCDNCTEIANVDQRDTDEDGYGNWCDGDLNNDGATNTLDLNLYKQAHRTSVGDPNYNPDADFNGDGTVNTLDLNIYKGLHRKAPGPSCCGAL